MSESLLDKEQDAIDAEKSNLHKYYKTTGWTIDVKDDHPRARAFQRHPDHTKDDWEKFHINVVHGLNNAKNKQSGNHVIFSKSHNIGVVASVNRDRKHIRYVSILPIAQKEQHTRATLVYKLKE